MKTLTAGAASAGLLLFSLAGGAQAHLVLFQGTFAPEATSATGSGTLSLEYDEHGHTLHINASFSGLSGNTNNAHIHCCTATPGTGTAGIALATSGILPDFPLGVKSGTYTRLIELNSTSSYSASFVTASGGTAGAAEARLIANLLSQQAYLNIHTSTFGGGEIRAFVTAVPEPATWLTMALGLGLVGVLARRRIAAQ